MNTDCSQAVDNLSPHACKREVKLSKVKLSKVKGRKKVDKPSTLSTTEKAIRCERTKQQRSRGKMLDRLISICKDEEIQNKKLLTWLKTERDNCTRHSMQHELSVLFDDITP